MTSWLEAMGWGFWVILEKNPVSWNLKLDEASWDPKLGESSWDYGVRERLLGQWVEIRRWTKRVEFWTWVRPDQLGTTRCAARCWVRWNSQHSKNCVSLSLRVEKRKCQEGNKSFVPELKKFVSVSGFLCIWTFYVSVYFVYPYHGYITVSIILI